MIVLGIVLLFAGAGVAVAVDRTIGLLTALAGLLLIVLGAVDVGTLHG